MNEGEIGYSEEVDNIYDYIDEDCDIEEIYSWTDILYQRAAWDTVKILITSTEIVEIINHVNK